MYAMVKSFVFAPAVAYVLVFVEQKPYRAGKTKCDYLIMDWADL